MTTNDWTRTSTNLSISSQLSGIGSTPTQNIVFTTGVRENASGTSRHTNAIATSVRENPAMLTPDKDPRYIAIPEIARRIGADPHTVETGLSHDRFPFRRALKMDKTTYYDRAEVEAWIDAGAPTRAGWNRILPKKRAR